MDNSIVLSWTTEFFRLWLRLRYAYLFGNRLLFEVFVSNGAWNRVHIFKMPPQISTLSELLVADLALERPHRGVLAKVVPQVAALAENWIAASDLASEVQFGPFCVVIEDLDRFVPFWRNSFEKLVVASVTNQGIRFTFHHRLSFLELWLAVWLRGALVRLLHAIGLCTISLMFWRGNLL